MRVVVQIRTAATRTGKFSAAVNIPVLPKPPALTSAWNAYLAAHVGENLGRTVLNQRFRALPAAELKKYQQKVHESYEESLHQVLPIVRARLGSMQIRVPVNNRRQLFMVENYPVVKAAMPQLTSQQIYDKCLKMYHDKSASGEMESYALPVKAKRFYLATIDLNKIRLGLENLQEYSHGHGRAPSSWNLFLASQLQESDNKRLTVENTQEISAKWTALSEEEKGKFKENANQLLEQRKSEEPLPYDYEDYILSIAYQLRRKFGARWMRSEQKKQIKSLSPWTIFFTENVKAEELKSYQNTERMKILSEKWKALPESEKHVYINKAKQ